MTVHPGDQVGVSASYATLSAHEASFVICDFTTGLCGDTSEASNPPDNHAEWILERTAYCNGGHFWLPALTSFSVVNFTDGEYDLTGTGAPEFPISHGNPNPLIMEDVHGNVLATPSTLDSTGTAFLVEWNQYGTPSEVQPVQNC